MGAVTAESAARRHAEGFRAFQTTLLRILRSMRDGADDAPSTVKPGDLKSLVSAFKEAVMGERLSLGMEGGTDCEGAEEGSLRWRLLEESEGPGGERK